MEKIMISIDEFIKDRKPCGLLTEFGLSHTHTTDCDLIDEIVYQAYLLGEKMAWHSFF